MMRREDECGSMNAAEALRTCERGLQRLQLRMASGLEIAVDTAGMCELLGVPRKEAAMLLAQCGIPACRQWSANVYPCAAVQLGLRHHALRLRMEAREQCEHQREA